ncbi:trace amine-associated receptor 13c-like [Megalops cyprinoides]|uniref:trace amine-associated receptor 13c-like n=1 Tax=Megalops cyprinoides TaxID=118141 RepID=UPI001864B4BD|nr:trace amine-associated receptor 13c-like [Megalops cyprinoides]
MNLTEVHQERLCSQSSNSSCSGRVSLTAVEVLMYSATAAVVLLTVCGNLLVIISICHFKQLHTPTNLLLLSLAVSDLLVGVLVMPFHFSTLIQSQWCFGAVYCTICNVAGFYLPCVSIYNVSFIAMDRYFALSNPFFYASKVTVRVALKVISIFWLYSFFYNFALVYFNGNITEVKTNTTCVACSVTIDEVWATVDFVAVFVLPTATMIILYVKIFVIAKKHANTIRCVRKHHVKDTSKNNSVASEKKAAKTLGIQVTVFLMCLIPYYLGVFIDLNFKLQSKYLAVTNLLIPIYMNSSMNPIIYALFYPWFQKCVKLIVTLRICDPESSLINVHEKRT